MKRIKVSAKVKNYIRTAAVLFVALLLCVIALRSVIIRSYADRKIKRAEQKFSLAIHYDRLDVRGLTGVEIDGLSIVPVGEDTLFSVDKLKLKLNPWKLLIFKADLKRIESDRLRLSFIKRDSLHSNFDFFYRLAPTDSDITQRQSQRNYARQVDRIMRVLFDLMPSRASMRDMNVLYRNQKDYVDFNVPLLELRKNSFSTQIRTVENGDTSRWVCRGELDDARRRIQTTLYSDNGQKVQLPFLEYRWGARVEFDTLSLRLDATRLRSSSVELQGSAAVSGLNLYHRRVSPEDVLLDRGEIDYKIEIGDNYAQIDSATLVRFNRIDFNPYLRVERNEDWHITASVNKPSFDADDLFSSLPKGLFSNLEGIKTKGKLSYHFLFDADMALIDSLRFESQLKAKDFAILSYGKSDLRLMNGPFTYTAYEQGVPVRTFTVGEGSANFAPLASISPLLQMAVMQSEDGAFFYHNGFLIDCLRDALIADIKLKRFARGGSTITMQLVKNVFLNRNKTIARKAEEALIVWLIEGQRLTSKQRMYEVYLNIAEWGPGIYGAKEAARYYFDKEPSALDVNEAIFLAGLIPHPKRALASFDDNLLLKPYHEGYFRLLASRLAIKEVITPEQAEAVRADITIRGEAKKALLRRAELRAASMLSDSLVGQTIEPIPVAE